ncbi:mCG147597 [Mus musculus]|jgi:hypothetical protein|nr:mCG147597 [Mus musculus]
MENKLKYENNKIKYTCTHMHTYTQGWWGGGWDDMTRIITFPGLKQQVRKTRFEANETGKIQIIKSLLQNKLSNIPKELLL